MSVLALVVAGAPAAAEPAPAFVEEPVSSALVDEASTGDLTAPDGLSASVLAKLRGVRVEDLSQRTELGSVFALPDGTWQAVMASGPVWVRTGGDGTQAEDWAAVDTSLSRGVDGDLEPGAVGNEVSLSGGEAAGADGVSVVAEVTDAASGATTELTWPGDLPVPSVDGPRATYAEVREGVDMVVEVTSSGVEQYFVVKERPAVGESVELPVQVSTPGATALEVGASSVDMVSADGVVVAGVDAPLMWDATADAALGNPVTRPWDEAAQPALWAVDEDPDGGAGRVASGKDQGEVAAIPTEVSADGDSAELVMTPADGFLQSPQVQFPVVVDPSVTLNQVFDTMVQSNVSSSDLSSSTDLLIGTWDGGSTKDRSFLGFTVSGFRGTKVTSATLNMFMYHSYSCSAREWQVWSTGAASTSTRWSAQPTWAKLWASPTTTKGYSSSCADGWVNVPITTLAQAWADGTATTGWVGLRATSETDSYAWKRFYSGNASSGKPTLTVTYNSYPSTPTGSSYGAGEYAWYPNSTDPNKQLFIRTTKPSFSAVVSDADGGNVKALFDVLSGSSVVWSQVPGGQVASGHGRRSPVVAAPRR